MRKTQCSELLHLLMELDERGVGRRISPMEALNELGCFRLAARVKDLRDRGVDIKSGWRVVIARRTGRKVKVKEYWI